MNHELKSLHEHINMIRVLQSTDGWKLYQSVLDSMHKAAIAKVMEEKDPFMAGKHLGAMKAALDLSTWAEREIWAAEQAVNALTNPPTE